MLCSPTGARVAPQGIPNGSRPEVLVLPLQVQPQRHGQLHNEIISTPYMFATMASPKATQRGQWGSRNVVDSRGFLVAPAR